ncbi:hypothetical protein Sjap_006797 [Stephania japonica]|uniref:Homeobox domain-containing protein n=1 Tax=Stephania japonica TaxID=461633 RepID=A0AAP0K827_9MAGN
MDFSMDNSSISVAELESWKSTDCFQRFLESQRELVHSQIDQLQKIVFAQCRLTGANPLSQEMAAGALSINIGKRPRDLLNPKAVKYMQSVFAVKDAVSKKESREISALCGVTVTQVREFFSGQRARVRKLVRLSRDKSIKSDVCKTSSDGNLPGPDSSIPIINPAPLNSLEPNTTEEAPSCSSQEVTISGIEDSDKKFVDNIFSSMRKEVTFSGQVKLMDWILQIQNSSVLSWFLNNGGLMILTAWLSEAALEEQTTILLVILKVLCHLPLHKALPVQMSAILQSVNRLRFYRTSDISNRAKVLLSRWSKMFIRNQALKKPSVANSFNNVQNEKILKQCNGEMLGNDWPSNIDLPEEILQLAFENSENNRNSESLPATKLLTSSADDSNKKQNLGGSSTLTRERRKVLPVEQPGQNKSSRNVQVARIMPSKQGRPMSADDIKKAKMRASFMQSKYGNNGSSSNENQQQKIEDPNQSNNSLIRPFISTSKLPLRRKIEEGSKNKLLTAEPSTLPEAPEVPALDTGTVSENAADTMPSFGPAEPSQEELKMKQIPWRMPPEMRMDDVWRVGVGEKSKEVEIQMARIKRTKETTYQRLQDIPPNPREPWDLEIDHDDTLTPEIPTEQPPDLMLLNHPRPCRPSCKSHKPLLNVKLLLSLPSPTPNPNPNPSTSTSTSASAAEPDLELLAVLLKNPELVFALTGQGSSGASLTSAQTVQLLDMLKSSQTDLTAILNSFKRGNTQQVEPIVSLPSPTPPSERMTEWRPEVVVSRPVPILSSREATVLPSTSVLPFHTSATAVKPQTQMSNNFLLPPLGTATAIPPTQQLFQSEVRANLLPDLGRSHIPDRNIPLMNSITNQVPNSLQHRNPVTQGLPSLNSEVMKYGQLQTLKPAQIVQTPQKERFPLASSPLETLLSARGKLSLQPQQPNIAPEPPLHQLHHTMQWNSFGSNNSIISNFRQTHVEPMNRHKSFEGTISGSNLWSQANPNNHNMFPGRSMAVPAESRWERNGYVDEPGYETWSSDRSPGKVEITRVLFRASLFRPKKGLRSEF